MYDKPSRLHASQFRFIAEYRRDIDMRIRIRIVGAPDSKGVITPLTPFEDFDRAIEWLEIMKKRTRIKQRQIIENLQRTGGTE